MFYKTLRAAFNCVANLLVQPEGGNVGNMTPASHQSNHLDRGDQVIQSSFIRENNQIIFASLHREFEYLMGKLQSNHRSKRFISQMTTVVRALQCSLNYNSGQSNKKQSGKEKSNVVEAGLAKPVKDIGGDQINSMAFNKNTKFGVSRIQGQQQAAVGEIILPDNEAIELFVNFYKLLFLGTKFAKKMLKITLNTKANQIEIPNSVSQDATDSESCSI